MCTELHGSLIDTLLVSLQTPCSRAHLAEEVERARSGLLLVGVQEEEWQLVILKRQATIINPWLCFLFLLPLSGILPLCTAS